MPGEVTQYLELVQQRVLEELLFVPGSSLFSRIQSFIKSKMKGDDVDADTGIDGIVLDTTLSRVMTMVAERTACLCAALCQVTGLAAHQGGEFIAQALGDATSTLLLNLLGAHLDMLFGQHITAIVLAGIFCTARMHGLSLKFRLLTEVATSCSPCHDATVFEGISLRPVHTGTLLAAHMADGAQQNGSGDLLSSTQDDSLEEAPGVGSGPVGSVREVRKNNIHNI